MDLQSEQINHKNVVRQMKKFMLNMHTTMFAMETVSEKEIENQTRSTDQFHEDQ